MLTLEEATLLRQRRTARVMAYTSVFTRVMDYTAPAPRWAYVTEREREGPGRSCLDRRGLTHMKALEPVVHAYKFLK